MLAFIDDGYTEKGYIAGVDRLYPAVRFEFRPTLHEERREFFRTGENKRTGGDEVAHIAAFLERKITSWDLKRGDSTGLPIEVASFKRLKPALLGRLSDIVLGIQAPDEDPDATAKDKAQLAADKTEAAAKGEPFRPPA
jgi:hypothetical protein